VHNQALAQLQTPLRPNGRGTPPGFPRTSRLPLPVIEAPQGGRPTNPPRSQLHRLSQDQAPRQITDSELLCFEGQAPEPNASARSTAAKKQSARRGQLDRLRLDPGDVANSKAARLNAKKRAAPQESKARPPACSSIAGNDEAGHGRHRPAAPPERAQDARSRPRPGAGRPTPENASTGPPMRPESTDQVRGGRPGRAGA